MVIAPVTDGLQVTASNDLRADAASGDLSRATDSADLAFRKFKAQGASPELQAKALYRKGQALLASEQPEKAIPVLQRAAKLSGGSTAIFTTLAEAVDCASPDWHAQHWATLIEDAEKPAALSSRDGRLLRRIAPPVRLEHAHLIKALQQAFAGQLLTRAKQLIIAAGGSRPGKGPTVLIRGYAYLAGGSAEQAVKDARAAQAYGASAEGTSTWAEAWILLARGLEKLSSPDHTEAGLAAAHGVRLSEGSSEYQEDLDRILLSMPRKHAEALEEKGIAGLQATLAAEEEEAKPEFLKQRPKYYYYYRWMTERIEEHCAQLPGPVMDKLLTMDAGELDLLLQHESAIKSKAQHLEEVLADKGAKFLETYRVPMLSWEEVKALKGPGLVGLGAPGGDPIGASKSQNEMHLLDGIPETEFEVIEGNAPKQLGDNPASARESGRAADAQQGESQDFEDLEALE